MADKMLVTQALDERDLLVKKIHDKIAKANFVDTVKPNEEKVLDARVSLLLNPHAGDNRMPALSGSMVSTIFGFR